MMYSKPYFLEQLIRAVAAGPGLSSGLAIYYTASPTGARILSITHDPPPTETPEVHWWVEDEKFYRVFIWEQESATRLRGVSGVLYLLETDIQVPAVFLLSTLSGSAPDSSYWEHQKTGWVARPYWPPRDWSVGEAHAVVIRPDFPPQLYWGTVYSLRPSRLYEALPVCFLGRDVHELNSLEQLYWLAQAEPWPRPT